MALKRTISREEALATLLLVGVVLASVALADAEYTPKLPPGLVWAWIVAVLSFTSMWLTTAAHELAHALTATALTGARIEVHFPTHKARDTFAIGKLDFVFAPDTFAHAQLPLACDRWRLALIALAGPLASLAAGAAGFLVARQALDGSAVLFWGGVLLALEGGISGFNLVPMRASWPGSEMRAASDGLLLLLAIAPSVAKRWFTAEELASDAGARPARTPFEGFGPPLVAAFNRACSLAQSRGHDHLSTNHLLAGLAADEDGISTVLGKHGVRQADVLGLIPKGPPPNGRAAPALALTPALVRALERARSLGGLGGNGTVEPAHVLLALLQEPQTETSQVLDQLGANRAALRADVLALLH